MKKVSVFTEVTIKEKGDFYNIFLAIRFASLRILLQIRSLKSET